MKIVMNLTEFMEQSQGTLGQLDHIIRTSDLKISRRQNFVYVFIDFCHVNSSPEIVLPHTSSVTMTLKK